MEKKVEYVSRLYYERYLITTIAYRMVVKGADKKERTKKNEKNERRMKGTHPKKRRRENQDEIKRL